MSRSCVMNVFLFFFRFPFLLIDLNKIVFYFIEIDVGLKEEEVLQNKKVP